MAEHTDETNITRDIRDEGSPSQSSSELSSKLSFEHDTSGIVNSRLNETIEVQGKLIEQYRSAVSAQDELDITPSITQATVCILYGTDRKILTEVSIPASFNTLIDLCSTVTGEMNISGIALCDGMCKFELDDYFKLKRHHVDLLKSRNKKNGIVYDFEIEVLVRNNKPFSDQMCVPPPIFSQSHSIPPFNGVNYNFPVPSFAPMSLPFMPQINAVPHNY